MSNHRSNRAWLAGFANGLAGLVVALGVALAGMTLDVETIDAYADGERAGRAIAARAVRS